MTRSWQVFAGSCLAIASLALCLPATATAQSAYTIVDLGGLPGNPYTTPFGIDISGQITGISANEGDIGTRAFLYSTGTMTNLGVLDPDPRDLLAWSRGNGINASGQVAGTAETVTVPTGFAFSHAFLYSGGKMTDLGTLGGTNSGGNGINDSGQVTGSSDIKGNNTYHAFLYSSGRMKDLGTLGGNFSEGYGINAAGQITGDSATSAAPGGPAHAFFYSGGMMWDIGTLGGDFSQGNAINTYGRITGISATVPGPSSPIHAFLRVGVNMQDLGSLTGSSGYSYGYGINDAGQVVGFSITAAGATHAFLSIPGKGMVDLNTLLPSGSGWTLFTATGINNAGQITGSGEDAAGFQRGYLLTPPPIVMLLTLVQSTSLPWWISGSLENELRDAAAASAGSGIWCEELNEFMAKVRSLSGNGLTGEQAGRLIGIADKLTDAAKCYPD